MKAADFLSAPEDLLPATLSHGTAFEEDGWKVAIEPYDLAYPRTPFFIAKRGHETRIIEIQSSIDIPVLREWARYCKSCDRDTRISAGLDAGIMPSVEELEMLRELGVGIMTLGANGSSELLGPKDLAIDLDLPDLPAKLRATLGEAYDHFDRGLWREGFEAACTALEQEARVYLRTHANRGRISFVTASGNPKNYTVSAISKMTMGSLAKAFDEIQIPNVADTRIGQSLKRVNEDRITVAHYKGKSAAREKKLRKNVAQHMFVVVSAFRYLKNIKP
jgi:hypothetical protein